MLNSYNFKNYRTVLFEIVKGKKHGEEIAFWESGGVRWEKSWKSGKLQGEEIYYFERNGLSWKRNWEN